MRILLLPITTRRAIIYCEPLVTTNATAEQSYLERGVNKATDTWASWEKAPSGWKLKLTTWGNSMLRRIPYPEWGLKSIPSISAKRKEAYRDGEKVEVTYPGLYQGLIGKSGSGGKGEKSVVEMCKKLGLERQGLHRKRLYGSVIAMPFTIPFGLIPVLPNIPFFYLAFRAYSHFRALRGSEHLDFLVKNDILRPQSSAILDALYSKGLLYNSAKEAEAAPSPSEAQSKQVVEFVRKQRDKPAVNNEPSSAQSPDQSGPGRPDASTETETEEVMLLRGWNGKLIADKLELPGLQVEIERAVEQIENELVKGK